MSPKASSIVLALFAMIMAVTAPTSSIAQAKDPRLVPNRLASNGDSITEAINAEEFNPFIIETPNHWASFVNGYHGFWEDFFGRTDVQSHSQRITQLFGEDGRTNYLNALSGANSTDLADQAAATVAQQATYVPLFMGHNDVCDDSFAGIPTDAEFEGNVRLALDAYQAGLPAGATVHLIGIVDIYSLWQLGEDLDALGIVPCPLLWATTLFELFPCATMLSPANTEADRLYTRQRNIAFNQILEDLALEYEAADPHHYYSYSDVVFQTQFVPSQVSDFDCFHPSAEGQRDLAAATWEDGPFSDVPEPAGALPFSLGIAVLGLLSETRRRRGSSTRLPVCPHPGSAPPR